MPGPPPKPRDTRQNRIKRPEFTVIAPQALPAAIPEPPPGLLKSSKERWETYWRSHVAEIARHSDGVDLPGLHRWILNLDEWTRAMRAFRRMRIVLGSKGQERLNPLAQYLSQREIFIREAEMAYGMTPLARLKLGIAVGQAKLTAQALNAALEAPDDDTDAELGDDWEQA